MGTPAFDSRQVRTPSSAQRLQGGQGVVVGLPGVEHDVVEGVGEAAIDAGSGGDELVEHAGVVLERQVAAALGIADPGSLPDPVEEGDQLGPLGRRSSGAGSTARAASSQWSASPWSTRVEWMSKITPADRPGGGPSVGAGGTVGHAGSLRGNSLGRCDDRRPRLPRRARRPGRRPARADADPAGEARAARGPRHGAVRHRPAHHRDHRRRRARASPTCRWTRPPATGSGSRAG